MDENRDRSNISEHVIYWILILFFNENCLLLLANTMLRLYGQGFIHSSPLNARTLQLFSGHTAKSSEKPGLLFNQVPTCSWWTTILRKIARVCLGFLGATWMHSHPSSLEVL
jgi:hypothetical protein